MDRGRKSDVKRVWLRATEAGALATLLAVSVGAQTLTVKPERLSYKPGDTIVFAGEIKTTAGVPLVGRATGVDDPVGSLCALGPMTDRPGKFTYRRAVPSSTKVGVYAVDGHVKPRVSDPIAGMS